MITLSVVTAGVVAALAYLRDPPWLAGMESGFRRWETADGARYRWIAGHASFFVPATATAIVIPTRTAFDNPGDPGVLVSITIDDRAADEFVLRDDRWRAHELRLPPPEGRRLRRIDVRVDRLRQGMRGAQIGEVRVVR